MQDFEKLGAFFLGRPHDLSSGSSADSPVLYDSKDLTTHAVCVGMTGSGKTGLCVGLLEEAAMDGVPAIAIDPKGDLGNLLLTFPDLLPCDFEPWVNADDARRKGLEVSEYATAQAELWRSGLASWGQDGERIRRLKETADFTIYTPGSTAGIPLSIVDSFSAPSEAERADSELMADRVSTAVSSLLAMVGIDADPIRSREHILLSTILDRAWSEGRDMELAGLIQAIQTPPVTKVGVLDIDSFYPPKERFELAMTVNNLLAAPSFETWLEGEPLDVGKLLYTSQGRPRVAVISIAHLDDSERMFFVSLLLNEILGWTRRQEGTSSLRALVYMDEIFGYLPPVANPPSKRPLLTMLKQARAHGVGVVLATQNPVDLDYKALSNTGTWWIGRLQTERDKARLLEGLEGVAAGDATFDRGAMEETLAGLGKRKFLMHNVHEAAPIVFETRWVMSYLRGPMTRNQIRSLMADREPQPPDSPTAEAARAEPPPTPAVAAPAAADGPPVLPPDVPRGYAPISAPGGSTTYVPHVLGAGEVHFVDRQEGIEAAEDVRLLARLDLRSDSVDWDSAEVTDLHPDRLDDRPAEGVPFAELPSPASQPSNYRSWEKDLSEWIYRRRRLELFRSEMLDATSRPGETEAEFRIRLGHAAREKRDAMMDKLRDTYSRRIDRAEEKVRKAEQRVETEKAQSRKRKLDTAVSFGTSILEAVLGSRRITASRARSAVGGLSSSRKEAQDVEHAEETLQAYEEEMRALEEELKSELEQVRELIDPTTEQFTTETLRPRRTDVRVDSVSLVWVPESATP